MQALSTKSAHPVFYLQELRAQVKFHTISCCAKYLKPLAFCRFAGVFGDVYRGVLLDQNMRNPQNVAVKTINGMK